MEPEDEAFEELALKQGHWQHTSGWRKKQIMETSMTQEAFKAWWYTEGSQAPYTHHDCEEHTMRMCEIAWANGAFKEREACANMVDHILREGGGTYGDAIRIRGQA
jgi:hypothetical protein